MIKRISKKTVRFSLIAIALLAMLAVWIVWGNTALELNTITVSSERLPKAFSGYRIAHVSDLHNDEIGQHDKKLLVMLESSQPDMIAITGDLIDSRNTDVDAALEFAEAAVKIAPCYYVTGNHESRVEDAFVKLEKGLKDVGVVVMRDEALILERNGESISLIGLDDPGFASAVDRVDGTDVMIGRKLNVVKKGSLFTILLSHRPELFYTYIENDVDLVLSGHAHGGQFRIPFVGGLVAPNQGFFPEYDAGRYTDDGTSMIVSRGIGNSIFPFRFNNRPEIIVVELHRMY